MSDPAVVVRATTRQSFTVGATVGDAHSYAAAAAASGIISGSNTQSNIIDDDSTAVRVDMNRVHEARQAQEERRKSSSSGDHRRSRNVHGKQAGADDKPHHRHKHRVTRESPSDSFSGKYAVDVRGVSHSYDGKKDVLHKLDLQIETGQIYGLLGPSGCGKTTLIKALLAQLDPKEGDIKIFGEKPGSANSQVPGHDVGL
jgi:ABC-type multidrug transport system fused ATPase/permease subunit